MTEDSLSLLHGYIYEISNGRQRPVAFASISVSEAGRAPVSRRTTGTDGSYSFPLFPGMYTIRVEKPGFMPQGAFVILEANDTVRIDFYLEKSNAPYEAQVIIEGLPPGVFPKLFLDGIFHGWVLNGSSFLFMKNLSHTVELEEISEDGVRYVLASGKSQTFMEAETKVFRYSRQFYVNSSTDPWRDGWYDEGPVIFEAAPIID
ncbi:MAG: carboxypeptidase-like regulatory domain-containing protein, partial [Candidatus Bathyarchaeia archaeon]